MSRAGVVPDIPERCLAHATGGVRGVYDRHTYHSEEKRAFEALVAQIGEIIVSRPEKDAPNLVSPIGLRKGPVATASTAAYMIPGAWGIAT
jgi:hypothetical protein